MSDFSLSRSTHVAAPPERVRALVEDFRAWREWSPWEGLDPGMQREYGGPDRGVGATYHWAGNRKAGEGRMEVTASEPSAVVVALEFLKPFAATNVTTFTLTPSADGTDVTWTMTGERSAAMALMGRLFFDRSIGHDFERGLASLKSAAERP